jgi:uncharacterized membrane protein
MATAMQSGQASLVLPISQLSFTGSALIGMTFLKERVTKRGLFALGLGALCIALMALDSFL